MGPGSEAGTTSNVFAQISKQPNIVIASEAKQSSNRDNEELDCFVALLLAMTTPDAPPRSRGAARPRFARNFSRLQKREGAGNAGCSMAPAASHAK
jgi:hypothetical protein